jgi:hypothetical protein
LAIPRTLGTLFFNFTVNIMRVFRTFLHFLILPFLVCPLLALADPVYTMRLLPSNFTATGLNNAGQVVGNVNYEQVAIWSDAGLTLMPELGRSVDSVAISNRGEICGSVLGLNGAIAFSYSSGALLDINSGPPPRLHLPARQDERLEYPGCRR